MTRMPFFVVIVVTADIVDAANKFLEMQGYGKGNFNRAIILKTDVNTAPAKAYGCMVQADPALRTILLRKSKQLSAKSFIFWSMNRRAALQEALSFIDSKGYKLKP